MPVGKSAAVFVALSCAVACSSNEGGDKPPVADAAPTEPASDAATIPEPAYEANGAGLKQLLTDVLEARGAKQDDRTYVLTESLRLRDYESWFKERFGPKRGPELAADYKIQFDDIEQLAVTLEKLRGNGRTQISVEKFEGPEDSAATGYQVAALRAMKPPVPLYSVRLKNADGKKSFHIWSFVHDGKSFRYVGKMKPIARPKLTDKGDLLEYRVADAKLLAERLEKNK